MKTISHTLSQPDRDHSSPLGEALWFEWNFPHLIETAQTVAEMIAERDATPLTTLELVGVAGTYVAAHEGNVSYGIHLHPQGIAKLAEIIRDNAEAKLDNKDDYFRKLFWEEDADEDESALLGDRLWLIAAMVTLYWREMGHAWVEDLVSMAESITGNEYYLKVEARSPAENRIAALNASGMIRMLFCNDTGHKQSNGALIVEACCNWLKSTLPGDEFNPLPWWSAYQEAFLQELEALLVKHYQVPACVARHCLQSFFDPCPYLFPGVTLNRNGIDDSETPACGLYMQQAPCPVFIRDASAETPAIEDSELSEDVGF